MPSNDTTHQLFRSLLIQIHMPTATCHSGNEIARIKFSCRDRFIIKPKGAPAIAPTNATIASVLRDHSTLQPRPVDAVTPMAPNAPASAMPKYGLILRRASPRRNSQGVRRVWPTAAAAQNAKSMRYQTATRLIAVGQADTHRRWFLRPNSKPGTSAVPSRRRERRVTSPWLCVARINSHTDFNWSLLPCFRRSRSNVLTETCSGGSLAWVFIG